MQNWLQVSISNGISLSPNLHRAFDRGLITINADYVVRISPVIKENEIANLVVFNPNTEWHLNDNSNYSKSVNSPYYNKKLNGKILFTANQFKSYKSTF